MNYTFEIWAENFTDDTQEFTACVAYHKTFLYIPYVKRVWLKSYFDPLFGTDFTLHDTVGYNKHIFETKEWILPLLERIYLRDLPKIKRTSVSYNRILNETRTFKKSFGKSRESYKFI